MARQRELSKAVIDKLRVRWATKEAQLVLGRVINDLKVDGEAWPAFVKPLSIEEFPITKAYVADLRGVNFDSLDLSEMDFCFADLRFSSFRGCLLNKTIFQSADISYCDFTGSSMQEADLFEVQCYKADFTNCVLNKAMMMASDFTESNFRKARMNGAVLDNSDLRGCILKEAELKGADLLCTKLPKGFKPNMEKSPGFDIS